MSLASSIGPSPRATARSTTLRSSRTLPGQWYSSIFSQRRRREAADLAARLADEALAGSARPAAARRSRRSRSGGTRISTTCRRKNRSRRNVPVADRLLQRLVRRRHHAHVDLDRRVAADALERVALQDAQELRLRARRPSRRSRRGRSCRWSAASNLPIFFSVAPVNAPFSWPNSSLSSSVSVRAAQLRQTNGPSLPRAGVVDGPGHQFLAGRRSRRGSAPSPSVLGHPADLRPRSA